MWAGRPYSGRWQTEKENSNLLFGTKKEQGMPMESTVLIKAHKMTGVRFELGGMGGKNTENMTIPQILKEVASARPAGILNSIFYRNLLKIDSNLPLIYAGLVYMYYRKEERVHSLEQLIMQLTEENIMGFYESWIYEDKLKRLLVETAYGMSAEKDWDGGYAQIVKSIVLDKDGQYYRFLGSEKEAFGHFLIENCEVTGIDEKVHENMGIVYEQGGKHYMNLALCIVF